MNYLALCMLVIAACKPAAPAKSNEVAPEPLAEETTQTTEPEAAAGFVGVLTPKSQAEVVAPFSTSVKKYLVNVGDSVEVGAKLAILDDAPLKEALGKADADLKGAQASYSSAASNAAIQLKAFHAGVAAKATYLQAEGTASEARARYEGAKAGFDATKLKLGKTTVLAQIAGKVALQYVKTGGQVAEGAPILRVISSDELYIRFAIPTGDSAKVTEGMLVDVQIGGRGEPQIRAHGKVVSIQPELDPIARRIFAEAELVGEVPAGIQAGVVCRILVPGVTKDAGSGSAAGSAAKKP